ncbi:MAG: hypothetical protein JSV16_13360, partial [Candidatus Hydrogenedentota bacterium]
ILANSGNYLHLRRSSSNYFQVTALQVTTGSTLIDMRTATQYTASAAWIHLLISVNLATGVTHFLVNGEDDKYIITGPTDNTIDFTRVSWAVGAQTDGTNKLNGALSELVFQPSFVDGSDQDVIDSFYRPDHTPEYIGGDASIPFDDSILLYLPNGDGTNNCGVGGSFTENGTPGSTGGPLGPHRTISMFVDGVKGTDAQAKSNQPDFQRPELIPDPTCATDFMDSKGTGWSHDATDDEYDCDGTQTADSDLTEGSVCVNGFRYRVEFEIKNYSAGKVCPVCGTQEGTDRVGDGVYVEYLVSNGTDFKIRGDLDFVGSVTNIYVCEDRYTGFWIGTSPSATGYMTAMNYVKNWEIIPRAIPDEEIQARR